MPGAAMNFTLQQTCFTDLARIARDAGAAIMEVYRDGPHVRRKADQSPVTEADELAEAIIVAGLVELAPDIPIVAEEAVAAGRIPDVSNAPRYWLVDPLDGTREFIDRNGEFTVNIALIEHGAPVAGVVYAPAIDRLFAGATGHGARVVDPSGERGIRCRLPPSEGLTVLASRSHGDRAALQRYLSGFCVARVIAAGSSLKLCLLAEGAADLYPRFGRTMEWDIAAGHAVLAAAGGSVRDLSGAPLRYGKRDMANPDFVARGLPG
jgi:3'(2'), 5'-bisphosphate nucleotidase